MAFSVKDWQNAPSTATPLDAAAFVDLETRLSDYTDEETLRAEAAESANATNITAETSRAEAAEATLATAVSTETTRAEAAEATKATITALTSETTRAEAAESTNATAISAEVTRAEAAEALKAPLASPALTGAPTAPTQTAGDNSTKIATDAFVTGAVATETTRAQAAEALAVLKSNNGSDFVDAGSTRTNLHVPVLTPAACVVTTNVATLSGLNTYDGYQTVAGDLILLTAQTTASQNGLWTAAAGAWIRPTEMATGVTMKARTVAVINGTLGKGSWMLSTNTTITVDTTAQTWVAQLPGSVVTATGAVTAGHLPEFNGTGNATQDSGLALSSVASDVRLNPTNGSGIASSNVVDVAADVAAARIVSTRIEIPKALSSPQVLSYLRGWWDASDPLGNGGSSFPASGTYAAWQDKSGAHGIGALTTNNASYDPVWTPGVVNGLGAYTVPGSNQHYYFTSGVFSALSSLGSTFFMVVQLASTTLPANANLMDTVSGEGARRIIGAAPHSSQTVWQMYGGTTQIFSNGTGLVALADTGVAVLVGQFPASGIGCLRRNGATIIDNQFTGFGSPPMQLTVGGGQGGNTGMPQGSAMCEFGIIDRNMTLTEIQELEQFLIQKWCPDAYIAFPQGNADAYSYGIQPTSVIPGPTNTPGTVYGIAPAAFKVTFPVAHRFLKDQILTANNFTPSAWNGLWVVGEVINPYEIIVRQSPLSTFAVAAANAAGGITAGNMGTVASYSGKQLHVQVSPDGLHWVDRYGSLLGSSDYAVTPSQPDIRNGESLKVTNPDGSVSRYLLTSNTNSPANSGFSIFRCDDPFTQVPVNWYWVQDVFLPGHLENVNVNGAWGCTAFIDTAGDGNVHVIVPSGTDNVNFTLYEVHPTTTLNVCGAWSTWTPLTFTGSNQPLAPGQSPGGTTCIIDPFMIKAGVVDGNYHLFYKRENWILGAAATAVSWSGGIGTMTISTSFAEVIYVGGHVELGGRGTVWSATGWNGIYQIASVNTSTGVITLTMPSNPGSETVVGDLSIEFLELAHSSAITGPYTVDEIGNWAGLGRGEAQKLLNPSGTNWLLYFDNGPGSSVTAEVGCVAQSSTGITGPWSTPAGLTPTQVVVAGVAGNSSGSGQVESWPHSGYQTGSVVPL